MRTALQKLDWELRRTRAQIALLRNKQAEIELQLQQAGELFRMGTISLTQYNAQVEALLGERTKDEVLGAVTKEIQRHEREEERLQLESERLLTELPSSRTMNGMQAIFALIGIAALIGGLLVLDHPQGMVIFQPTEPQTENVEVSTWSTITPESPLPQSGKEPFA